MINKERITFLISDLEYLKLEAQSINQVIESVPYSEKPLDGASIIELFLTIDSIQLKILDIISQIPEKGDEITVSESQLFKRVEKESDEVKALEFSELSNTIKNNREELCSKIVDLPVEFFEVEIIFSASTESLFGLLSSMVKEERALLKEVANLVLTFQTDKQFQREIAGRNTMNS